MPIFEYRCLQCGRIIERIELRRELDEPSCPDCGASRTEKILSAAAVHSGSSVLPAGCGGSGGCCGSDRARADKPCMRN